MTEGDLFPDARNAARRAAHRRRPGGERRGAARPPRPRVRARRCCGSGPKSGNEPELPPGIDTLATLLRERGYHVALKGKWHLSKPVNGGEWSAADPERIERDYGFADWEPPDAGGDAKAETFGGGNAGTTHEGWDEDYTRQVEAWLAQEDLPEPFCLVFSLVNPHDVLGYPSSYERGGYTAEEFRDLGVPLPPTVDEDLRDKPTRAVADEARPDVVHRRARTAARRSRTTSTSTPTCTASSTRRSAGCWRRSATPTTPARCARAR